VQLSQYTVDRLRDDGEFILYRGRAAEPQRPSVLLLAPASTRPSLETLKKLDHEYSLSSDLDTAWAVRPVSVSERGAQITLVLEDPGGETLDGLISEPMAMPQFLGLAIGLARALGGVHKSNLIHKDVKPSNVLVNSATGEVRLIVFGIASRLRREHQPPEPPELIAGTLPYMAPEQTGRMNRSIDSRSDLYALGVTLYEMLTGSRPFTASEPLEWVHSHIARIPVPPHERLRTVPACVSAIVMKLLAKTPEERYQTASGVESDLRHCLAEWDAHGRIVEFLPGQHDAQDRLVIPEKLYGRAREIETLLTAFDRVVRDGRPELVLVSGYSGIGKSAVVNELHKPLVPPRGLFASGKFDQYKRDIPYATLAQAFQSLVRPLLSKREEELSKWRDALHEALDPNGQLIVALVPELKAIIGEQPPVPDLPPQEEQRRFNLVFRRFINVFARPEHPLALFLDDLQWLDAATLDLMEDLLTQPDVKHLMLLGAYRDNEVDATHPLARKLQAIRQAGAPLQDIVLAPLTRNNLCQLITDSLRCEQARAKALAELVHDKTTGNPFFATQFLSALFDEGLLTFNHVEGGWSWDLKRIHAKGYTDNVVDLMVRKLVRLLPATQDALKQLACLGNTAEFTLLRVVHHESIEQMHAQLSEAVEAGFVLRSRNSYRFLHDRVQEAAYSLIPQEGRAQAHLRIGRLLAAHTSPDDRHERIFEIVNQLNRGVALITSRDEKDQLAEFNLIAGKRAQASTAYVSALHYLVAGTALLEDDWDCKPDLMFALALHRAECEFLTGELAAAEERLAMLASRAAGRVDQAAVVCLRIDLYTTLNRSDRAVDVALDYLRHLGGEWLPHPTEEAVRQEYDRTLSLLGDRRIEDVIDAPLMSKPESAAAVEVMDKAIPPATFTDRNLFLLLMWRIINFSLEHGNTDASCYAYIHGGILAGVRFGDYKFGFRLGQLGYDLVERRGLSRFKARTHIGFGVYNVSWTRHWRMARELMRQAFDEASTIGDVTWAAYSWHNLIGNVLAAGDPLAEAQDEADRGLAFARKIGFGLVVDNIATQLALIRTLRGATAVFGCFNGAEFDEVEIEHRLSNDPGLAFSACWYWIRKLQARFFAGDYSAAVEASLNAQPLLWLSEGFVESAELCFYGALSHAASCDPALSVRYRQHIEALTRYHEQLAEWAENCPANFENRLALVGAEIARIEGRELEAEQLYERAIHSAHSNGFVHNAAIAYELAAHFYATRGFEKFANAYLLEARYCYQRWGAEGKVAQLDHLYAHLRKESSVPTSAIVAPRELLDLATVMKVSQALSGGMELGPLIDSLMRAAIEHAGAERGLLIRLQGDQLLIEAEAATGGDEVTVHQREGPANAAVLPESVVRYVMRTRQDVILDDATVDNPFSADPYILYNRARSVLCLPLINQANLTGVLYLENNLSARVFTPARITILKLLASRAAISLENSRLYRDLEDRERARNRLLAVRADVNLALATNDTLTGILQSCADAVVKHLNAALARIWLTTKDQRFLELHASAGMSHVDVVHDVVAIGHLNIGRIAHERTPHVTNDVTDDPRFTDGDWARSEGMVSFAGFPLLAGGQVIGVLEMLSKERISQAATETLGTISDTIAQGIQRERAEEAVRRSETFLAEAQALSQTGSWGWNTATGDLFWSRETYRIFGFESNVNPTLPMVAEAIHPDDRARFEQDVAVLARDHMDFEREYRLKLRDGSIKHVYAVGRFAVRGFPDLDCIGAIMDVTERKQAADALLDERVAERTRIARELHDTLLQSFQGLMLRFQSARHLLPGNPTEAVRALDGALDRADQAIAEGRDAIQNLRSSTTVSNELAQAITSLAEELTSGADGEKSSATFRISIEGTPRDLHPDVRDDVHRIAREALRNAFRHAQAAHIEAEVTYGVREVRLRIRDDGTGIDTKHLSAGRTRHWGLAGMRERAEQIGARLNLWSKVGAGTEVELRVPSSVAYGAPSGRGGTFRLSSNEEGEA
jgi:predicted ATPase/GAF domain-containing protein/two-component sensor histidine kinase